MSSASSQVSFVLLSVSSLVGGMISVVVFRVWGIVPSCRFVPGLSDVQRFKKKLSRQVFFDSLIRSIWCVVWLIGMARINLAFPLIRDNQEVLLGRIVTWSVFLLFMIVTYLALTSIRARFERLPILMTAGLCMALAWYPSFFSKRTLHVLGIGGGILIEILLRTMNPQEVNVVARLVHGCLILNAGSRVIIQPMNAPTADACSRELPSGEVSYANMYIGIEVFSSSDIIKLSGFTSDETIR